MRQTKEGIDAVRVGNVAAPNANLGVAASPVGSLGAPAPYDPLQGLAQALSGLNPALNAIGTHKAKEDGEEQKMLGARAREMQVERDPIAMTPEQNPYWQQGYMEQHGKVAGQAAANEMLDEFERQKDNPEFNPHGFVASFKQSQLAGLKDPDALKGMLPALDHATGVVLNQYSKQALQEFRANQSSFLMRGASDLVKGFTKEQDPIVRRQAYEAFAMDQVQKNGMTKREVATTVALELIARSNELRPEDFQWAFERNPDDPKSLALAEVLAPDGTPLRVHLEKGMAQAEARRKKDIEDAALQQNYRTSAEVERALLEDPMSLGDPVNHGLFNSGALGLYKTPAAVAEAIKKVWDAQKKVTDENADWDLIMRYGKNAPRSLLENQVYKKRMEKMNKSLWLNSDLNDPKQMATVATTILRQYEDKGIIDARFESMLKNVGTMGFSRDANGEPTKDITPEFRVAHEMYRAVRASNNPQLMSLIPEEGRVILDVFNEQIENGATEANAFRTAKMVGSPDARAAIKIAFNNAAEENEAVKGEESYLTSNFRRNENGAWISASNSKFLATETVRLAKQKFGVANGALSMEQALKIAREEVQATHTYDGYGSFVRVPPGANKGDFRNGMKMFVEQAAKDYKAANGKDLAGYAVMVTGTGPDMVYTLRDPLMNELASKPYADIHQDYLKYRQTDVASIAKNNNLVADYKAGKITSQQIAEQWPQIQTAHANGMIDSKTFERMSAQRKAVEERAFRDKSSAALKARTFVPQGDNPMKDTGPLLIGEKIVDPKGANLSTKEYALEYAKTNPDFALTAFGEGMRLDVYKDKAGKRTIGLGYNIDARDEATVRREFTAAGITGDRIDRVLNGEEQITPREAVRLYEVIKPEYVNRAKKHFGPEWDQFPPHVKAVMVDIAYNGGVSNFPKILEDMQRGDWKAAADKLSVSYTDHETKKSVYNARRVNLWRGMLAGPDVFTEMVKRG
jgi:GH24 family phage-related lysozyme (muramidase)